MIVPELNCDFAEGFGPYDYGDDAGLAPHVQVMNLACGVAGGDPSRIVRAVGPARMHGLKVGAHPSLPDREGFGRRRMMLSRASLRDTLIWQIGAVKGFLDHAGILLNHVKPHGLLNSMAGQDADYAEALCDAAEAFGVGLYGQAGPETEAAARRRGLPYRAEFFVDLAYADDGHFIVRKDRVIGLDWMAARLHRAILEGCITAESGPEITSRFDTV